MTTYFRKYFLISSAFFIVFSIIYAVFIRDYVPFDKNGDFQLDGKHYVNITKNFPEQIRDKKLSTYDLNRFGPSLAVRGILQALNLEFSNVNIRGVFYFLNIVTILASLFYYFKLAENFRLARGTTLLGLVALFSGFFLLKMSFFYPNNTDMVAFLLGMAALYYYRTTNSAGLLACLLVGEVTWPTMPFYAGLLFILPRNIKINFGKTTLHWHVLIALVISVFFLFLYRTDNYLLNQIYFNGYIQQVGYGSHPVSGTWLPLSLILFYAGMFTFLSLLLSKVSLNQFHIAANKGVWIRGFIALALLAGFSYFRSKLGFAGGSGWRGIMRTNLTAPIIEPGIFMVSHLMYFGPVIFLIAFHLKKTFRLMREDGIALLLIFATNHSLFFTPESRCFIPLLPMFALYALKTWDDKQMGTVPLVVFSLIGLLLSKVFLNIGSNMDLYSMNAGPWMPEGYFWPIALICSGCAVLFYFGFMRQLKPGPKEGTTAEENQQSTLEAPVLMQ